VDLSPRQRSALFVLVVIVLGAFGYYLVVPALSHSHAHPRAAASPSPSVTSTPTQTAEGAAPTVSASAVAAGGANIYAWLPFTQADLAAAASVTVRFGVDYDTFTYTENAAAYVGAMRQLITGQLAATLRAAYQVPGVAALRKSQKQVSTGTAVIESLRAFGPSSITFIVAAGQRLVTSSGTTSGSTLYAVTVTSSGNSWQVSDIELESAGNS
jgi:type II secretory pathway component PulM